MDVRNLITIADGTSIAYRLDGASEPNAPLIVLSSPSLVDWTIWDEFISAFFARPQNKGYRVLRYLNRGCAKHCGHTPLTLDILTEDVVTLLDTLNVSKAAAMTGISLGGLTALNLAIKYPDRVATVLPCDFFPTSPPGFGAVWDDRVKIAQKDKASPKGVDGTRIVGKELAELTVKRWLSPKSFDGGVRESRLPMLEKMVYETRLDGLISIVQAISSYDLLKGVENATVPGAFIAGADDSPVHASMKELANKYGKNGTELYIVQEAGHIPAVEQPQEFARLLTNFIEANSSTIRNL